MNLSKYPARGKILLIIALLSCIVFQCGTSMIRESPTIDEPQFIGRSITSLLLGNEIWPAFVLGDHHPPLPYFFAASPVLLMRGIGYPADRREWLPMGVWRFGSHFVFDLNMDLSEKIVHRCRLMTILFSVLLGIVVYSFARRLYGSPSGLFALFLYTFSPSMLAYARYAVEAVYTSFFIVLSIYAFYEFLKRQDTRSLVFAGAAFGLAQLAKYTALILIPSYLLIILLLPMWRKGGESGLRMLLKLGLIFGIGMCVVWLGYGFDTGSMSDIFRTGRYIDWRNPSWEFPDAARLAQGAVHEGKIPLVTYLRGIWEFSQHAKMGHSSYLMGEVSHQGWWYYYVVVFFIKTPLPILILLALRLCLFKRVPREWKVESLFFIPIALTFAVSIKSHQNLGIRQILFIYPLIQIYVSGIVLVRMRGVLSKNSIRAFIVVLCAWYVAGTIRIWPHYLAYFNEVIGGPKNGYKYLVDSNLDLGQDLKGLKRYMAKNDIEKVIIDYFGFRSCLKYYGIKYELLKDRMARVKGPEDLPIKGVIAISANVRAGIWEPDRGKYSWLDKYEPADTVGYSILIYKF